MTAHKHPPIGALTNPCVSPRSPEGASAPQSLNPLVTCDVCSGSGEVMFLAVDGVRYEPGYCEVCDGTGEVEATCETCSGKLVDGWCPECEDYGLVFVERISPTRIAL